MYYQHVRGLRTKNVLASNYDLLAITVFGINGSIKDGEFIAAVYKIFVGTGLTEENKETYS